MSGVVASAVFAAATVPSCFRLILSGMHRLETNSTVSSRTLNVTVYVTLFDARPL